METQQKYRRLQTSTRILWVKENEDGSLFITDDFEKSIWVFASSFFSSSP